MARRNPVFDYRSLRLLVGIVALSLPLVVILLAPDSLASISASYCHDNSRDAFVGSLFAVGAFLFAYRGHSDIAEHSVIIHRVSAASIFGILAFIAWFPFRRNLKGKSGKQKFRSGLCMTSATIMAGCVLTALVVFAIDGPQPVETTVVFWTETIALVAFGIAWIVSGKFTRLVADGEELYRVFGAKG